MAFFFSVFLYLIGDILWETSPSMQSDWGSLIREMLKQLMQMAFNSILSVPP